mmetsp:Transcript_39129/g.96312  ORF Transcript_39129/g.96312 Transcript_39129/m.96312 type:complete len:183 (-) Transcript_39129:380-928(-)
MQRHPQGGRGRLFLWATAFLVIGYLALVWGVFAVPVRRSPQPSADTGANHGGGLAASGAVAGTAGQENPVMACKSTKGDFTVTLRPDICPHAARQIASMVSSGFLSQGIAFWQVNRAITQFGADESHAARLKRGADDPFDAVRKPNLVLDPHPVCAKMGYLNSSSCKASKEPSLLAALKAQP